jgi:hypothetical protein
MFTRGSLGVGVAWAAHANLLVQLGNTLIARAMTRIAVTNEIIDSPIIVILAHL